jgi:hypothetical protein
MPPRARKVARAMAQLKSAQASGNKAEVAAALRRAASAPQNSAKSSQLARLVSKNKIGGGGAEEERGSSGYGGEPTSSTCTRADDDDETLTPPIPGIPRSEVSDAWVADLLHTTGGRAGVGVDRGERAGWSEEGGRTHSGTTSGNRGEDDGRRHPQQQYPLQRPQHGDDSILPGGGGGGGVAAPAAATRLGCKAAPVPLQRKAGSVLVIMPDGTPCVANTMGTSL